MDDLKWWQELLICIPCCAISCELIHIVREKIRRKHKYQELWQDVVRTWKH